MTPPYVALQHWARVRDEVQNSPCLVGGVRSARFGRRGGRVGGRTVQGLDHLVFRAGGQVGQLTVMIRPLSGVIALAEAMGPRVAHREKG